MNRKRVLKKNFIVIGSPGSGKGTLCEVLREKGYFVIALGQKLRQEVQEQTELGRQIQENIDHGILIADDLAFNLISQALEGMLNAQKPFVIEGFPSTINQYQLLVHFLKERDLLKTITLIYLDCPEETALERMINRLTCQSCSHLYNLSSKPPRQENRCDLCGKPLFHRKEDTLPCALHRINTFKDQTFPIVELAKEHFPLLVNPSLRILNA
ncbi:MAG: adenylate kinase family protein [Chlamydiales bacterium]